MKYFLLSLVLFISNIALCQQAVPSIDGTWKAISKIETETTDGKVTEEDKDLYEAGEKTYTFTATTVTISQAFGKHVEKMPLRIQDNQLFIGKRSKNKQPYVISMSDNRLILTKTEHKEKKGKSKVETEVITLEK